MAKSNKHKWSFPAKFRKGAYSWKGTAKASRNLRAAVSEIKKVAKWDPEIAAEGATRLLEKLVPSIERIDGSSGAIGGAVNKAVEALAAVVAGGAGTSKHEQRVERVFEALQDDGYGYLDHLGDHFGEICGDKELARDWGLRLSPIVRACFTQGGYFSGTSACLSSLAKAGCFEEVEQLLQLRSFDFWPYDKYRLQGLVEQGKIDEAIQGAEKLLASSSYQNATLNFVEDLLIEAGRAEEAFDRYGPRMRSNTYLASFRATAKKYPDLQPEFILKEYLRRFSGEEGKWFATARSLGLNQLALELAKRGPCNPKTILTGAESLAESEPDIAFEMAFQAVNGYVLGWGYEVMGSDIVKACSLARRLVRTERQRERLKEYLETRRRYAPKAFETRFLEHLSD